MDFKLQRVVSGSVLSENAGIYTVESGDSVKSTSDLLEAVSWLWNADGDILLVLSPIVTDYMPGWANYVAVDTDATVIRVQSKPPKSAFGNYRDHIVGMMIPTPPPAGAKRLCGVAPYATLVKVLR
jgi:hypothetical protein